MKTTSELGKNVTGIALSPKESRKTIEFAETAPAPPGDETVLLEARQAWAKEADPLGSVPPPATVRGAAKEAVQALKGKHPTVYLDCVAERLGFERTGTRLYEALLAKLVAAGEIAGGPKRVDLERLRDDELRHFQLLREAVGFLGGDPTVMTPAADVAGVEAVGLMQVLTDPRTTFEQSLHAILIAELADNDGWRTLLDLTEGLGQKELVERFRAAQRDEDRHLADVRRWLSAIKRTSVGLERGAHA